MSGDSRYSGRYTFQSDYRNETDYPKGCYLQSGVVYFNVHGIGSTKGYIASGKPCRAICSAQDYTTTVGKCADRNNTVGGYCLPPPLLQIPLPLQQRALPPGAHSVSEELR